MIMKKISVIVLFLLPIMVVNAQFEATICSADDSMSNNLSYYPISNFKCKNSRIYYKTVPKPQIFTTDCSDTLRCVFEFKLCLNTLNDTCICIFSDYRELFVSDSTCDLNDTERLHHLYAYVENEFSKRLYYSGPFDNDIAYFALPMYFIPIKD